METQGQSRVGRTATAFAVFAVMCLVLGATVVYYNSVINKQVTGSDSATATTTVTSTVTTTATATSSLASTSTTPVDGTALAIYSSASKSVVTIVGINATTLYTWYGQPYTSYSQVEGSGFVTEFNGSPYIVTNFHVVDGVSNITVTFSNGDAYLGKVVGSDVYADLAVVSITAPASEFFPLAIVESSGLQVGLTVYAIGAPYGLTGTFTSGLISQLGRTIQEATAGDYSISGIIQFTAPINPGNSGGPLLDSNGGVIGITTATISGSTGLGFAIPSQTIIRELPSLITNGSYTEHSYLGIGGEDMTYQLAEESKSSITYGVLVEQVTSGGPADEAGIKGGTKQVDIGGTQYLIGGDIIISANGTRLINMDALSSYLEENMVAGQTVVLGIVRAGVVMNATVTLGERPQP